MEDFKKEIEISIELSIVYERIMNSFYKSAQWEGGEITGIDMIQLEGRIKGILSSINVKEQSKPQSE